MLDRYYLSFDRNQKAIPAITATVYKNGIVTNDSIEWETEDLADAVNVESSGNTATVEMKPGETTGQANVTAKLASNPMISASCFVEVIDSYAYETEARELVVETSSMVMDEGKIRNIGYEVIPSYIDERSPVELTFTYSESDIVEAVQNIDNREIEITALKAGTVDVTATVKGTDVSDTFRVRVEVPNERPVGFRISVEEIMTEDAEIVLVAYGISSRVAAGAVAMLREEGIRAGLVRPKMVFPFPKNALRKLLDNGQTRALVSVELSAGQMIEDIRLAIDCRLPVHLCSRMGGNIPSCNEICDMVKAIRKEMKS